MSENNPAIEIHEPETIKENAPVFDAGGFTITHASPMGFELVIDRNRRRRDTDTPLPLTDQEKETLRDHLKGNKKKELGSEIAFMQNQAKKVAAKEAREVDSQDYVNKFAPNVGIRNIREEEIDGKKTLIVDTKPVTFKVYSELITRDQSKRKDLMDFGESSATAAAIFTKDGNLILQYRGKGNRAYSNTPGASAAGMLKSNFNRDQTTNESGRIIYINRGILEGVDPLVNINTEISEELQEDPENVELKLVGIAHDEIKPHTEFMYVATLDKTADELADKGLIPDEQEGHDFKERYFTIDGTPESIETLITKVKCPVPTTHAAVIFMAGIMKVGERDGEQAAIEWGKRVAPLIKQNTEEIDRFVIENYDNFPSQSTGKPERSKMGYDPLYTPEEQGLPSLIDELVRTGLIGEEMYWKLKNKYTPENNA